MPNESVTAMDNGQQLTFQDVQDIPYQ